VNALQRLGVALRQRQRWLLIALLALLHLALVTDPESNFSVLCWLVDVGLFILWQPFDYAERKLDLGGLGMIALILGCGVVWYGWWLLLAWVVLLAALVGGRVMFIDHRPTRFFYLIAFAYLLAALLVGLVPHVVAQAAPLGPSLNREFAWGMPAFLIVMSLLPTSPQSDRPGSAMVDLFYSLLIFLLITVLVLGSLAFMLLRQFAYLEALLHTLMLIAVLLLLIGWLWNTRPGFTGIDVFFSRYLLTIGLPFEKWLHRLTTLAAGDSSPERFLSQALAEMLALPWVDGGAWSAGTHGGSFGQTSRFRHDFAVQDLALTLHTRHKLSPALLWHFHLLAQLAHEHYVAKRRARELEQVSYLRAIHETGARLTHDVKNLLQSLNNLCYLAQTLDANADQRLDLLLRRQLPQIAQRLQQTLTKLQEPQTEAGGELPAEMWWRIQQQRCSDPLVVFESQRFDPEARVPTTLFDSITDNLLQNALVKRHSEPSLQVTVMLTADASRLSVCDNGSAVRAEILGDLLHAPVASENGLGIGLFHAAKQAEGCGYTLCLASNAPGRVCFELSRVAGSAPV